MISSADITAALAGLGVQPTDTLFVHSDMRRLLRAAGAGREEKLATVVAGLHGAVANGTLLLPTFSYSFCRGEPFSPEATPSTVGLLTEYFRRRPGVRRTAEPLFSTAVLGPTDPAWESALFGVGDKNCFGEESIFAYLVEADAKLAFLGVDGSMCTFVYLIEQRAAVPYRFFKDFAGDFIDSAGDVTRVTARYFVRRLDADVENSFAALFRALEDEGALRRTTLDRGAELTVVSARAVAATAAHGLDSDPAYLLAADRIPAAIGG